jgi:hypothetical protein
MGFPAVEIASNFKGGFQYTLQPQPSHHWLRPLQAAYMAL